jgi:putative amide transporter protein
MVTLILSFTTCTIPGFLLLLGDWGKIPTWAVVASIVRLPPR